MQMTKRYIERFSIPLIDMVMQIKTMMRYHLTPVRTAIDKNNKFR